MTRLRRQRKLKPTTVAGIRAKVRKLIPGMGHRVRRPKKRAL